MYGTVLPAGGKLVMTTAGQTSGSGREDDELTKLRRENLNEEYRRRSERETMSNEGLVDRLLGENQDLRRKACSSRDPIENEMRIVVKELQALKAGRDIDKDLLGGLQTDVGLLTREKETKQVWMHEALTPGNKRGTISISTSTSTPECDNRGKSGLQVEEAPTGVLREELRKMKDVEFGTRREVKVLKNLKRSTDGESKRLEAKQRNERRS
ncbi:hypothetical protein CBR_g26332 [Chara braunii]|uniref:Uncharacterized protein n=1 Tax=Chara braunii TaxID=69332 RepID=A0A388L7S8_CHABU|nr:hypothetical protein CBR_g26332 [Chara braunii]|eukprot:GBG78302.1 hypothetical protein CBR_g26332 [Chara braunii]